MLRRLFQRAWLTGQSLSESLLEALSSGLAEAAAWTAVCAIVLAGPLWPASAWDASMVAVWLWLTTADRLVRWGRSVRHNLFSTEVEAHESGGGDIRLVRPWGTGAWITFDRSGRVGPHRLRLVQTADGLAVVPPGGAPMPLHGDQALRLHRAGVRIVEREQSHPIFGAARPIIRWGLLAVLGLVAHRFAPMPLEPAWFVGVVALVAVFLPPLGWFDDRAGRVDLHPAPAADGATLSISSERAELVLPLLGQRYGSRRMAAPFRVFGWGFLASVSLTWGVDLWGSLLSDVPFFGNLPADLPILRQLQFGLLATALTLGMLAVAHRREPWTLVARPAGIELKQGRQTHFIPTGALTLDAIELPRGTLLVLSTHVAIVVEADAWVVQRALGELSPMYLDAGDSLDAAQLHAALNPMRDR